MASRGGLFDPELNRKSLPDVEANRLGIFDPDFVDATAAAAAPEGFTQDTQGTASIRRFSKNFARTAVIATALFITNVDQPNGALAAQPDTWTQPVQGTSALGQASHRFTQRAVQAFPYYFGATDVPLATQPDTWTSPVDGQSALRRAQQLFAQRSQQTGNYYWQFDDLTDGPLPVQPDTWVQPVQGVANLSRQQHAWQRIAAGMGRLWQTPEDDTVQGTQPETWPQPVQGIGAVRASAQAYRTRAIQTALYWELPQDPPPVVPVDQWAQPVVGTSAIKTANQQLRARAILIAPLLWQTPEDVDGPLPIQPDTYQPPIQGTAAIGRSVRLFRRDGLIAQAQLQSVNDVPAVIEPDTWTQPTIGIFGLRQQQTIWRRGLRSSAGLWQSSDLTNGILPTQPETWQPPIAGLRALGIRNQQFRAGVIRIGSQLWQLPPEDITSAILTAGPQEFFIVDAEGRWFEVLGEGRLADAGTYLPLARANAVGFWRLDQTGATMTDSVGTNNGTAASLTTHNHGPFIDGSGAIGTSGAGASKVTVPDSAALHLTSQVSFSCWVKADPTMDSATRNIWAFGDVNQSGFTTKFATRLDARLNIGGNSVTRNVFFSTILNLWFYLVCTYDGSTLSFYINGTLADSIGASGAVDLGTSGFILGNGPSNFGWKGLLKDAVVYGRALTAAEVLAIYQAAQQTVGGFIVPEEDRDFEP